ncbi:MAG: toll/interleukin-1 receptor domain-containing protein [Acidobacteria bacterium]|nr:toll/interleukin-1 receptor domain-containing protein [Acidobacteriota bacterium]
MAELRGREEYIGAVRLVYIRRSYCDSRINARQMINSTIGQMIVRGWRYLAVSCLLGLCLWLLDLRGAFLAFDSVLLRAHIPPNAMDLPSLVVLLVLMVIACLPGWVIDRKGNEIGLVSTASVLGLWYLLAWLLWQHASLRLPVTAPLLAAAAGAVRGLGWAAAYREREASASSGRQTLRKISPEGSRAATPAAFISYRREGGADTARLIRAALEARGYSAFLDVESLGASHFDERLFAAIEQAPNFLLILSPGSLDRCHEPDDWLRREIGHALATGRNIVPLLKDGFVFPPAGNLPADLADLSRHNGIPMSHVYFDAAIDKLVAFLNQGSFKSPAA